MNELEPRSTRAAESASELALTLLDRVAHGVLLLDEAGRIVWANAAAQLSIAIGRSGLGREGGVLCPQDPSLSARWRAGLARAVAGQATMLVLAGRGVRVSIVLAPWRGGPREARVVGTLAPCDAHERNALRLYACAHGLSPSETEVLVALARGATPKAVAQRRGSSEGTVRSQVKAILLKTGHHGIREAVVDALRSAPMPLMDDLSLSG